MKRKAIRKLTKSGKYSYYVVIPKRWIDFLNWKERQKLILNLRGKKITIKDWKRKH